MKMKLFNFIIHRLIRAIAVTEKTDKKGRDFTSFSFEFSDLRHTATTWFVKSVVIYRRNDGGFRLLANYGDVTRKGRIFSASATFIAKRVNEDTFIVVKDNKRLGYLRDREVEDVLALMGQAPKKELVEVELPY